VDCEDFREALSARLDNEEGGGDADHPTDTHLEYCADCRYWYDAAALITRRTRTSAVVAWPDVSDAVLARVPPDGDRPLSTIRYALGAVGVLQCTTGLVTLATQAGVGFETGAWQLGLGVTLGAVAVRRLPARTLLPLLATLAVVLAWGQVSDGLHPTGIASLMLTAAALVLVALLDRVAPDDRRPAPPKPAANRLSPADDNDDVSQLTIPVTRSAKSA
jgi:predicted anti-sigma-YlaC factor YlaD